MRPLPPINRLESAIQVPSTTTAGAGSELRRDARWTARIRLGLEEIRPPYEDCRGGPYPFTVSDLSRNIRAVEQREVSTKPFGKGGPLMTRTVRARTEPRKTLHQWQVGAPTVSTTAPARSQRLHRYRGCDQR
jgi:hypothetical protein